MSQTTGLLDTSVFVAVEADREVDQQRLPELAVISVVTVAELTAGVLAANGTATRAARLATLESVSLIEQLPIGVEAATAWATMRVRLAEQGRRVNVNDLWIAATAVAYGMTLFTQDNDYAHLADVGGPPVVLV